MRPWSESSKFGASDAGADLPPPRGLRSGIDHHLRGRSVVEILPLARQTYTSIKAAVKELCAMPTLGRPFIDEALGRRDIRSWLVGNYRVFYTYDEEFLTVRRVIHTRQDIDDFALIDWEEDED